MGLYKLVGINGKVYEVVESPSLESATKFERHFHPVFFDLFTVEEMSADEVGDFERRSTEGIKKRVDDLASMDPKILELAKLLQIRDCAEGELPSPYDLNRAGAMVKNKGKCLALAKALESVAKD